MNPESGQSPSELDRQDGLTSDRTRTEMSVNPFEAPAEPAIVAQRSLTVIDWIEVSIFTLTAASIAFVGTCGGVGFLGFTMSYPRGSLLGEVLLVAAWFIGAFAAWAVGRRVGRALINKNLRRSKSKNSPE